MKDKRRVMILLRVKLFGCFNRSALELSEITDFFACLRKPVCLRNDSAPWATISKLSQCPRLTKGSLEGSAANLVAWPPPNKKACLLRVTFSLFSPLISRFLKCKRARNVFGEWCCAKLFIPVLGIRHGPLADSEVGGKSRVP